MSVKEIKSSFSVWRRNTTMQEKEGQAHQFFLKLTLYHFCNTW